MPPTVIVYTEHRSATEVGFSNNQFAPVVLRDAAMNVPPTNIARFPSGGNRMLLQDADFARSTEALTDAEGLNGAAKSPNSLFGPSPSDHDGYADDPRFLESQREFRDLLLASAQSLAPTRAATPEDAPSEIRSEASIIRRVVSTVERVIWLRKYLDEVAPWV